MSETFEFDGLKLRPVSADDYQQLEEWIAADPAHASLFVPDFFLGNKVDANGEIAPDPRATCYAIEDDKGTVFYIRLSRIARVHIQFAPARELSEARRNIIALAQGMSFLEVPLSRAGAEEWIFSSFSPGLRKLAERSLGFRSSPDEMVRPITDLEAPKNVLSEVQQASKEGA